ncbi:MAG: lysophospholipid acyltransferase family protein [Galbitalea sp.]
MCTAATSSSPTTRATSIPRSSWAAFRAGSCGISPRARPRTTFFDIWWRRGPHRAVLQRVPRAAHKGGIRSISAKSLLQRGIPLLVFPEGTRSATGEFGQFKPGAAALASSCNVPCIPVALIGVNLAHPRGTNWPKRGRLPVGVIIGEPMRARAGENPVDFTSRIKARSADCASCILRISLASGTSSQSQQTSSTTSSKGAHK